MDSKNKHILQFGLVAIAGIWLVALVAFAHDRFELWRAGAFEAALRTPSVDGPLPVLWNVPAFSARDQDGRVVTNEVLDDHVWVADFIFTRCTTACPLISAKMLLLRRAIPSPGVRFVSFSVDPDFDTPAVLQDYARRWKGDTRWVLLSSTPAAVEDIARHMEVPLEHSRDPDNPILHTTFFFLVDGSGRLRGIYDSLDDDAVKRLANDAQRLDAASGSRTRSGAEPSLAVPGSESERGRALFDSVGCGACHADARIAPTLAGIFGRRVQFEGGTTAVADDAYLRESILDPDARVVAGYTSLMPSYRDHLSDSQIADLVGYVRSMPAPAGQPAEAVDPAAHGQAIDPVCGMRVRAADASPHTRYKDRTYYFCSDMCRERFSKAPEKFVPGP